MASSLQPITPKRLSGAEPFHVDGKALPFDLLSFWRWYASDLAGNALRGCLAEYLVAHALGIEQPYRQEWDACDIRLASGVTVEVKSAAYHQSWAQRRESPISFSIAPTLGWDAATNTSATTPRRSASVYVFCLLAHRDRSTLDPLDVSQWRFFVLATQVLNARAETQKTISLSTLLKLHPEEPAFSDLGAAILRASGA